MSLRRLVRHIRRSAAAVIGGRDRYASLQYFERRAPSPQTAVDVFAGDWVSDLGDVADVTTGGLPLFADTRIEGGLRHLGVDGRIDGYDVLELGPLEGAHSHILERLGARSVTAIEANAKAFLKCLVVKEVAGLRRTAFLLGDFTQFLREAPRRYDLVLASGVLYHMADPAALIRLICAASDRCYLWSQYYDPVFHRKQGLAPLRKPGEAVTYYVRPYLPKEGNFLGGTETSASLMEREAILETFRLGGLDDITILHEDLVNPNGPTFSFAARRR